MRAVLMLGRADLHRRGRSVVVLTLLVGFAGAVALALFAGARRTETALARFESSSRSANVEIDAGDTTPAQLAAFRRTPGISEVALVIAAVLAVNLVAPIPARRAACTRPAVVLRSE